MISYRKFNFISVSHMLTDIKGSLSSPRAPWVMLGLVTLSTFLFASWNSALLFCFFALSMSIPGWLFCRAVFGSPFARQGQAIGHSLLLGLFSTTFIAVILGMIMGSLNWMVFFLAVVLASLIAIVIAALFKKPIAQIDSRTDSLANIGISIGILMMLIMVIPPFMNVGHLTPEGYVYAPYFNRDFLRNLAFGGALANQSFPPQNPYFSGEPLHYYWFHAIIPALVYQISGRTVLLEEIFLLDTLLIDTGFVFVLVHFLSQFIRQRKTMGIILFLALMAESYQAPLKALLASMPTHWALEGTWLGAIALPPVGYFLQGVWYLPQHMGGFCGLIIAATLLATGRPENRIKNTLVAGIILIISSGFSFFIIGFGFLWSGSLLLWYAILHGYTWLKNRSDADWQALKKTIISGILLGICGLTSYFLINVLSMMLEMNGSWYIYLSKYWWLLPVHFLAMLGPMIVLGVAGLWFVFRDKQNVFPHAFGVTWLFLLSLVFVGFIRSAGLSEWEISQKLGVVLRLAVLALAGIGVDKLLDNGLAQRRAAWIAFLLFCASALPNLLAYEVVHLWINNSDKVSYLDLADLKAATWMRQNLPLDAIIQSGPNAQSSVLPYYRPGEETFSLIPVFAERQTALGDQQFSSYFLPASRQEEFKLRTDEIKTLFESPQSINVKDTMEALDIDYIYWGTFEQYCCNANRSWYESSLLFDVVYDQDGVMIFQYQPYK